MWCWGETYARPPHHPASRSSPGRGMTEPGPEAGTALRCPCLTFTHPSSTTPPDMLIGYGAELRKEPPGAYFTISPPSRPVVNSMARPHFPHVPPLPSLLSRRRCTLQWGQERCRTVGWGRMLCGENVGKSWRSVTDTHTSRSCPPDPPRVVRCSLDVEHRPATRVPP
ncbi:hypothetical protein BAUCODRAFT_399230 [Baudoinia panamericana UAMH 10762]|uniref:Uncharacterized protein n=1 Tax=Baudoinia panamericana (strain UAMH 10762) TaxID=717646 RepID=M2N5L5_BAUPA|nr:uncharacterized protein BAUCODRAFT_399230 [Baudoinia panamericana UAMH 10762]EMC99323.1 hypothetical protein BAUCODRAFT_399230 [Baudoinia panamericana UAMH 10762]